VSFLERYKKWDVGIVESDGCLVGISSSHFTHRGAKSEADELQRLSKSSQAGLSYVAARRA
jgi:hypothetical protein